MSTSKTVKEEIAQQIEQAMPGVEVTLKPMMGEFLVYLEKVHIGGIYDGKFLLKETSNNVKFGLTQAVPYASAKRTMYYLEQLNDSGLVRKILEATLADCRTTKKQFKHGAR